MHTFSSRLIRALLFCSCLFAYTVALQPSLPGSLALPHVHAAEVTAIYDDGGRLVAVVDSASNEVARWTFDSTGNLLSLTRQSAALLSLIEFAPKCGAPTQVTLWGTGYSSTPSQNTVMVGGIAASVTSASATKLVVSVPAGGNGPITVTTPTGTTTSSQSFSGACS